MLDFIYHMLIIILFEITFIGMKMLRFCHYVCNLVMDVIILYLKETKSAAMNIFRNFLFSF